MNSRNKGTSSNTRSMTRALPSLLVVHRVQSSRPAIQVPGSPRQRLALRNPGSPEHPGGALTLSPLSSPLMMELQNNLKPS